MGCSRAGIEAVRGCARREQIAIEVDVAAVQGQEFALGKAKRERVIERTPPKRVSATSIGLRISSWL